MATCETGEREKITMAKQSGGIAELLRGELQDLLDAEKQLVRALPKMARAATDNTLEEALREHLEVTKNQVGRLSQAMQSLDMSVRGRPCKGMKGIVEEGSEMLAEFEGTGLNSAIAGAARKVEHYEMASYESARTLAKQLGQNEVAELLTQTLREEIEADKTLAQIAKKLLRQKSGAASKREMSGRKSNFNKLVKRSAAERRPTARAAR
jgi:ferritin-like metal-binding protein YciE